MEIIKRPTVTEYHAEWTSRFQEADVNDPERSADLIFAHLLKYDEFELVPDKMLQMQMTEDEITTINDMCAKKFTYVPTEYITGECFFYGINLKMRPPVFIPSVVETAGLVEHALSSIMKLLNKSESGNKNIKVLDVGCGSGAVSLSLLNILKDKPVEFVAIDAAPHAVDLMKENVERLGFHDMRNKLIILHHTLGTNDDVISEMAPFDVIIGNTPYVPTRDMEELDEEIKKYEDLFAYHGGDDGTFLINIIVQHARNWLTEHGSAWFEIDPSQPQLLARRYSDYWNVNSYKDVEDVWRYSHFTKK